MANPEQPVLYIPCYFDEATLRKYIEAEGGSKLKKMVLDLQQYALCSSAFFLSSLSKNNKQEEVAGKDDCTN